MEAVDNVLSHVNKIGIYSLSKTYIDELLWAHYGNSHNGYCIEYDLELLLKSYTSDKVYSFPIVYIEKPPSVDFNNIIKSGSQNNLIQKMAGYKSKRWQYEEEIRIVTEDFGVHSYDHKALTGIYFGLRMDERHKTKIMKRLKGRGIKYYQIEQIQKTYKFIQKNVSDIYGNEVTYMCTIPKTKNRNFVVNYKITEKEFYKINGKASIKIELDSKIEEDEIISISKIIKSDIFPKADRIFISFMIKGMLEGEGYWAIAKFEGENLEISINGLSFAQEKSFINSLKKDTRNTIGMWIDETPFMCSSMILLEENEEVILETKYRDNSISKEKFKPTKLDIGTRYNKSERDIHGEYFIVYNNGILKYFSEEGEVFKELYPFNAKIN